MAVPDFQSFFKPLLDIAADGKEHSMKEARENISWETVVWIAESPTHLIHFNGERLHGPYERNDA